MAAAVCLALGAVHMMIWLWQRSSWANLLFSICAASVAAVAGFELATMRAETPEQYTVLLRWFHVPLWVLAVSLVWFMRAYFGVGRLWLAWLITGVRTTILVINFLARTNFNYRVISELHFIQWAHGERIAVPVGTPNLWTVLGPISLILMFVYFVDITRTVWRRGDPERSVIVGGFAWFFILCAIAQSVLVVWGFVRMPYFFSFCFLGIILGMAYELSRDVHRVGGLSSALRESEGRIDFAASAAELGLWVWNVRDGNVWVTNEVRRQFGLSDTEQVTIDRIMRAIHPEDLPAVRQEIERALRDGTPYDTQYRVTSSPSEVRWIHARADAHTNWHNQDVQMRGITVDVTERKLTELESARQRLELTRLSRAATLGELSGSLAHELNQPLTAILSNAQAAQRFLAQENADLSEVREILADIVEDDRRAGKVLSNVRMLLKHGEVNRERIDLAELVRDTLHFVQSDLMNGNVWAKTELQADLPLINGDRVQMQQMIINLIINACHAMSGTDTVRNEITIAASKLSDKEIQLAVRDTGRGIPPENLERIFEPLYTTRAEGMGLGLAVCRTIVKAHGGKLWAANNDDVGATFYVLLPIAGSAA